MNSKGFFWGEGGRVEGLGVTWRLKRACAGLDDIQEMTQEV